MVNLLRDSFAGINARIHLAGAYTVVELLLRITITALGEEPEWFGIIMMTTVVAAGISFGILGLAYHAASGRTDPPSFVRYATILFLPLVWLQIKLILLTFVPAIVLLWGYYGIAGRAGAFQDWMSTGQFWIAPFVSLAVLVLALYSTPVCIHQRLRGRRGAPIRQGMSLYRSNPSVSRRLLVLVLSIAALGAVSHYVRGPASSGLVPTIPEGLILFVTSYLNLVAFFGATRVVLARLESGPGGGASAAPGPAGPPA